MATEAQIQANRKNAKKAGRKKGMASIKAEEARAILAQMVFNEITPIGKRLIKESKKGNVPAIKELFDRAFGKAPQAIVGPNGGALKIIFDQIFNKDASTSETETDSGE